MSNPDLKRQLYAQLARISKALAHGNRLELLEYLAQGERSVEALAKIAGLSIANTSQHLRLLRQSGLVVARKESLYVYYRIADDAVLTLIAALRNLAETRLAEVERLVRSFLAVKDELEPVPRETLLERVRQGLVTVIDVRPPEEFQAGHLPGAINLPLKELEERLQELPRGQEVVAYCRGPYCVLAYEAVSRLRARGFRARRLVEGFPEWKLAGLPVESGAK